MVQVFLLALAALIAD